MINPLPILRTVEKVQSVEAAASVAKIWAMIFLIVSSIFDFICMIIVFADGNIFSYIKPAWKYFAYCFVFALIFREIVGLIFLGSGLRITSCGWITTILTLILVILEAIPNFYIFIFAGPAVLSTPLFWHFCFHIVFLILIIKLIQYGRKISQLEKANPPTYIMASPQVYVFLSFSLIKEFH